MNSSTWKNRWFLLPLLGFCLLMPGCENDVVQEAKRDVKSSVENSAIVESFRRMTGIGMAEPGVVATVNGVPIYLREVEAFSDMRSLTYSSGQGFTLEDLWSEYAQSLYELIVQELTRQELHRRDRNVDDAEVLKLEDMIMKSYNLEPGVSIDMEIESDGISSADWRSQLKARLEQEMWQEVLHDALTFTSGEVEAYIANHPELLRKPETFDYILVESLDHDQAEQYRKAGQYDVQLLRDAGLSAVAYSREIEAVPELWREDIRNMRPGQVSRELRQNKIAFSYIVLLGRYPARDRTPVELYNLAQSAMSEEQLPELFNKWLEVALATSEIRVARQFLPENVPTPSVMPRFILPWERQGETLNEEALGEVEGEVGPEE